MLRNIAARLLKQCAPRKWMALAHFRHVNTDVGEYEITRIAEHVNRGKVALDIGSHNGIYSRQLLKLASAVIAFEANPPTAAFIRRALPEVTVHNVALSSREGTATLRIPDATAAHALDGQATIDPHNSLGNSSFSTVEVPTRTLDSFGLSNVGFVKIDVEGHEEEVLAGAQGLLAACHPTLMIEIEERHNPGSLQRIIQMLRGLGYSGYFYMPDAPGQKWRLSPIAQFDPGVHQSPALVAELDVKPRRAVAYVNNFLFIADQV